MKLDAESPYHPSYPIHEHASKVIGHNENHFILPEDNHFVIDMLKKDHEAIKEEKYDLTSPIERKIFKDTDPSQNRNFPVQHSHVNMEDSINGHNSKGECVEALHSVSTAEIGLVEKEDFYTDKTVTEVELSEMIVGVKDDACHIVKDICIDEGVHSNEKDLVENDEVDQKISSSYDQSPENRSNDLTEEMTGTACSHDLKCTLVNGDPFIVVHKDPADLVSVVDKDSEEQHSSGSSIISGFKLDATELVSSSIFVEKVTGKPLLPSQEFDTGSCQMDSSSLDSSNEQMEFTDRQKTDQGTLEEVNSAPMDVSSAAKESNHSSGAKEVLASGNVQSGIITFHFDFGAASISGREEKKEILNSHQSGQAQICHGTEEATPDGATASARSSYVHHLRGDSSISGTACLSGPIVSSGHIPYSGSISFRSDSSTTSARSFAFPILQSEWNSSPVKMAKADRSKHRGWRMGLLCCRF